MMKITEIIGKGQNKRHSRMGDHRRAVNSTWSKYLHRGVRI